MLKIASDLLWFCMFSANWIHLERFQLCFHLHLWWLLLQHSCCGSGCCGSGCCWHGAFTTPIGLVFLLYVFWCCRYSLALVLFMLGFVKGKCCHECVKILPFVCPNQSRRASEKICTGKNLVKPWVLVTCNVNNIKFECVTCMLPHVLVTVTSCITP